MKMDKNLNDSDLTAVQENEDGQSLVGKLKKNVSEIINHTPLSKWFRRQNEASPSVRKRQDDSEDDEGDTQNLQPPAKRTKLPATKETLNLDVSQVLSPINNVKKAPYNPSMEAIPGPSGYQGRKILTSTSLFPESTNSRSSKNLFNKEPVRNANNEEAEKDSDSEESTSGYSSGRIGSKEVISQESSKQASPLDNSSCRNRSLFQSSSHLFTIGVSSSPNKSSNLGTRLPSFNASLFGSSSFVDRTLSTKRILNSPFYNGNTIYGGASAYGRHIKRASQELRKGISIKPSNRDTGTGNLQLGKTARRILDTLEQYSSPVSDAKKIPTVSKKARTEGSLTKFIGANPYTIRESRTAPTKELQVPSITDLLKIKMDQQKSKLQCSTEAARKIANTSSSSGTYQIPTQRDNDRHVTKIRNKISSVRQQKVYIEETLPEVNLNPVSLPIKELPKFDMPAIIPAQTISTPSKPLTSYFFNSKPKESLNKTNLPKSQTETDKLVSNSEFRFSNPVVLAECIKPLKSINNFKFSDPLVKKRRSIHTELETQGKPVEKPKNNGENVSLKSALKDSGDSSNVEIDLNKFKAKEGTWECSICLIRNPNDKTKCAACESPKPFGKSLSTPQPTLVTPITFKAPENSWECPTCMIRNKADVEKCIACEEKKPGLQPASKSSVTGSTTFSSKTNNSSDQTSNIGEVNIFQSGCGYKPSADTWECPTCMIRNKTNLSKCAACETLKPGDKRAGSDGFGAEFKKKTDEWECQVCMIRNKSDAVKCQCCETPSPVQKMADVTKESNNVSTFNFGVSSEFTFGIPAGSQPSVAKTNASSVFGENREQPVNKAPTFTFGATPKDVMDAPKKPETTITKHAESVTSSVIASVTTAASTFTFGTPKTTEATSKPAIPITTTSQSVTESPKISFGAKTSENTPVKTTPSFTFGSASKNDSTVSTFTFGTTKKDESVPVISFGTPKSDSKVTTSNELFGIPKSSSIATAPTFTFGSANKTDNSKEKDDNKLTTIAPAPNNPLLKPNEKLPEKATVASAGFNFGLSKASPIDFGGSPSAKRTLASEDEPPAKIPMFGFKAPTSATNGDLVKNPLTLPKPVEEAPKPSSSGFVFNPSRTLDLSADLPVGTLYGSSAKSSEAPVFKFGANSDSKAPSNGFSFNSPVSSFGASKPPVSNLPSTKPFTFGSAAPATGFGAAASTAAPVTQSKAPMFSFGSSAPPDNKAPFAFNVSQEAKPSNNNPFGGGASKPPFGFGSTTTSSFSFGGSAPPNPFGSNVPSSAQSSATFGAPSTQPAQNGTFNFGATTAGSQKAGFSFGAAASESSPGPGGFNFGSSSVLGAAGAPAPTTGGFNFSNAAAPVSFDANAKPTFNFTGGSGVTAFSAPPTQDGTAMPQRKVRKAFRRMVR